MANEQETKTKNKEVNNEEIVNATDDINMIDANYINEIKKSTVSKEQYETLKKRYETMVRNNIDNRQVNDNQSAPIDYAKALKEDHKKLFGKDSKFDSNLDYFKTALEYRDACIKEKGRDPFIQQTESRSKYDPRLKKNVLETQEHIATPEESERVERVVQGLKEMIKESNNNPSEFDRIYSRNVRGIKC